MLSAVLMTAESADLRPKALLGGSLPSARCSGTTRRRAGSLTVQRKGDSPATTGKQGQEIIRERKHVRSMTESDRMWCELLLAARAENIDARLTARCSHARAR